MARRPPTDFELLRAIYELHEHEYGHGKLTPTGQKAEVLVPIDIPNVAAKLGVDTASIFGRLYYHLEQEYGEPSDKKPRKAFFTPVAGTETNCVNFPLLEAVLAGLWQQRRRDLFVTYTAVVSLGVALGSLLVSILTA